MQRRREVNEPPPCVSQGTQYERKVLKKQNLFSLLVKVGVLLCGILSAYCLYRMYWGSIPCTCTNNVTCKDAVSDFKNWLKSFWG